MPTSLPPFLLLLTIPPSTLLPSRPHSGLALRRFATRSLCPSWVTPFRTPWGHTAVVTATPRGPRTTIAPPQTPWTWPGKLSASEPKWHPSEEAISVTTTTTTTGRARRVNTGRRVCPCPSSSPSVGTCKTCPTSRRTRAAPYPSH